MTVDWQAARREFPALENWTFLNTATFGQLPRRAVEAVNRHFQHRDELACWDFLDWFDDADRIRGAAARLINCRAEDIAFVTGAAPALGMLVAGMHWSPGDRVVTLRDEFPNNLYYPALLGESGVEVVETPWEQFYDALTPNTRLAIMSTVNYTSGFRPPLREVSAFLRQRDIPLYLDGTQSVGALCFDAVEIQPAMMALHGYKWLLSPNGAGFMYVHPDFRKRLAPAVIGWRSHKNWRQVDNLHHGAPEFVEAAEKYEGGMLAFPLLYAMGASLDLMLELGPANIQSRVMELAAKTRDLLRGLGGKLLYDEKPYYDSTVIAARFEGVDASRLARELKARRVQVSARHGNLRVSVHFYNSEDDLARLEENLRALL
ncbi:MAG: aminotransferase class V-fold PLP-dependent enzyme [Bryobacteraceae bacterium]|nr:aminotransferase class V-fold PLP-dependent enzyme [Bryobacteraceae bacterium]